MEITYQGLRIVLPLDGIIMAEDVTLMHLLITMPKSACFCWLMKRTLRIQFTVCQMGPVSKSSEKEVLFKKAK